MQGLYDGGQTSDEEAGRLAWLDYPAQCAIDVIGSAEGQSVLDVGAGENLVLGDWVNGSGNYLGLDNRQAAIDAQRKGGHAAQLGSVDALPYRGGTFEIVVACLVLAHLPDHQQRPAIRDAVRVASQRAILMSYDWDGWQGPSSVMKFKSLSGELARLAGFDCHYGRVQDDEAQAALAKVEDIQDVTSFVIPREPGNHFEEMFWLAESNIAKAGDEQPELRAQLEVALDDMRADAEQPDPPLFTTPDIVATVIRKLP